ncbi:MAG: hypothetical protein MJ033_05050 [Victivallaceae bacterium]|nr:hypothetical protein [Victivallaceae bacterium]
MARVKYTDLQLSAEFKRDYIQRLALFSFFFILVAEVSLAISIPWYLGRENAMANEVARLNLFSEFDGLRYSINAGIKNSKSLLYTAELKVAKWDLDKTADHLRAHQKQLSDEEIAEMRKRVRSMYGAIARSRGSSSISRENVLTTTKFVDSVIPKEKGKNNGK